MVTPEASKEEALEPFNVSMVASIIRDEDGDFVLFCPRINELMHNGASEADVLKALGAD